MRDTLLVLASWVVAGLLILLFRRMYNRHFAAARTLISREEIQVSGTPRGLWLIDGVRVREGDTVILTRQSNASLNGRWVASLDSWRDHLQRSLELGDWVVATHGSNAGTLWLCTSDNTWEQIISNRPLAPIDSSNFVPNSPAETAAYLHRIGVPPSHILGNRNLCISYLMNSGFITRSQSELLRMKPENLTPDVLLPNGQLVYLLQDWRAQVVSHMEAIREAQLEIQVEGEGIQSEVQTPFTTRPLEGFKKIKSTSPENLPKPPERRSRYRREPLI